MTAETDEPLALGGDAPVADACSTPFERLPQDMIVRAFGVDYGHVRPAEGGDLYVTRFGWPYLPQLLPAAWYTDEWYARPGNELPGTGCVYHVSTRPVLGRSIDVVVKFSRVAQEVPLVVATTFPDDVPPEVIATARFNSPMEEFGLVMELRRGAYGRGPHRVLTQRPLAIYAPPEEFELWELGRCIDRFHKHWHLLAQDQEQAVKAIEFDIKRVYVLLYGWIKGEDAEQAFQAGEITGEELRHLTVRAIEDLRSHGFRVLDNKPSHFILRKRRRDRQIMRRGSDRIVYGLVDFELLQRTPEHQSRFKAAQREKYWHLQSHGRAAVPRAALPSHLRRATIFGVDYLFGTTPDGGELWVVGDEPELFDFFLPDRWRRTTRAKLSLTNEVYYTRTRDNIHVVYRRSRVGAQPRVDPLLGGGKRIREHGYNSPFEEVAIAEALRRQGIPTIRPRAIYRTGHQSSKAAFLRDERRFATHANQMTPGPVAEPILRPDYDYYTIWGYFRGVDPQGNDHPRGGRGVTDLGQACADGLIEREEYETVLGAVRSRLQTIGVRADGIEEYEFVVSVQPDGALRRNENGGIDVRLCIDAQTAFEYGVLSEERYGELIDRVAERMRAAGWEHLTLVGHHLLLSMAAKGVLRVDEDQVPSVVLCNFECVRRVEGAVPA